MKMMNSSLSFCLGALALLPITAQAQTSSAVSRRASFDEGWKFARFGKMPNGSTRAEPGAITGVVTVSSTEAGNPANHLIDGDLGTRWCAASEAKNQWLQLDLGDVQSLGGVEIAWEKSTDNPFGVEVSIDGVKWQQVVPRQKTKQAESTFSFSQKARYLRVSADGSRGAWVSVREITALDASGKKISPLPGKGQKTLKALAVGFNDESWRSLNLPHDWAIEGPFRMDIENETGKLPWEGVGWYRKHFDVPASAKGRQYYIDFDGAMSQAKVYINGQFAGEWAYGYNSFRIDATPHLNPGQKNLIAVRLENLPVSTRWYPGGGIYRHVWLVDSPKVHIAHWGTYVTTPVVTDAMAKVAVETTLESHQVKGDQLTVHHEIFDGEQVVSRSTSELTLRPAQDEAGRTVKAVLELKNPKRWDMDNPFLYQLRTEVRLGGKTIDRQQTALGVRSIEWHAQKGFLLNGRKVVLKGVCNHHDLGPLGAAVHTRGMERQIELLQEMGCNSIRTSHNPPAPEFLDLCDRMGVLVIDELFDIWKLQKYGKRNGYNIFWDQWHEKDIRNFMQRDRNHPSVIAWSTGNEIPELGQPGFHWVPMKLRMLIRQYDTTRPITAGSNNPRAASNGFAKSVDVYGVNYHLGSYQKTAQALPDMPLYSSESSSTVSTRGEYFFPVSWNKGKGFYQFQVSSYDLYAPGWANRPDLQFAALDKHPRYAGEYVWTGFDYIGEPTPYNQDKSNALNFSNENERKKAMLELEKLGNRAPSRSSYFGILDLCGFKKDRYYLYQSRWRPDFPVAHILPHWNWRDRVGEVTPVHVYTNGDEAELFLNGESLGKRKIGKPHAYRLTWDEVKYRPGKLEVVVSKAGKIWKKTVVETTGTAARLELVADRKEITADGADLSYLTVRVLDAKGREVPRTRIPVNIKLGGDIEMAGIGNGDPTDHTTMKPIDLSHAQITAFNGLAQVIVRGKRGQGGSGTVEVSAEGLAPARVQVITR